MGAEFQLYLPDFRSYIYQMGPYLVAVFFTFASQAFANNLGFVPVSSDYKKSISDEAVVTNMAPVRSQDSLGICYSFVAGTIIDTVRCKIKNTDCSKLPSDQKASVLDLGRFGITSDKDPSVNKGESHYDFKGIYEGGHPALILDRLKRSGSYVSEKCAPFDQIVNKSDSHLRNLEMLDASWSRLQSTYNNYKSKERDCPTCAADFASTAIDDIRQDFELKSSNTQILKAFAEESYSKFLDKLLVPEECQTNWRKMLRYPSTVEAEHFPKEDKKNYYEETMKKIKEVLKMDLPMGLSFCMDSGASSLKSCKNGHGVVITGYRKFCKAPNNCREALKVQNSWGSQWQKDNDDGWVDAKVILDRSGYEKASLTWMQPQRKL